MKTFALYAATALACTLNPLGSTYAADPWAPPVVPKLRVMIEESSDRVAPVPCEVQGNVTAPKCKICGSKCQCVNCGCPKAEAAAPVETVGARTARLNAVMLRTPFLDRDGNLMYYREWTVGEYLAAGHPISAVAVVEGRFSAEDKAFLAANPPVILPTALPAYTVAPYAVAPPAAAMPQRSVGLGFQGPRGAGFFAGYQSGGNCTGGR
jgi:hypothetical protein